MQDGSAQQNPLLEQDGLPPFERIQAEHVVPAIKDLIARLETGLTLLEKDARPDWSTLERLTDLGEPLGFAWGVVNHLMGVRNSPELRKAHSEVQGDVVMISMRAAQSEPLYAALSALRNGPAWAALDAAQQRTVDKKILEARLSGMELKGAQRDRFNTIEQELSELETRFGNNVLDATKAWSMELTDKADVAGLPPSVLGMAAQAARGAGKPDATPENGPWRITLDVPSFSAFMRNAHRRDLREKIYRAFIARAASGETDNTPLMEKILALRTEKARLLGFDTFARLSLATKMAPGVDGVEKLLEELLRASRASAEKDLEELRALARKGIPGAPADGNVALWDVEFLSERLREERFNFTEEELRPYFPLPRVLDGLFALAERLFDVKVLRADGQAPVWHKDVMFFLIQDGDGNQIASFYLDPYSRPENKRGGAWADECVARRTLADGKVRLPVAYLACNQSAPVGNQPSLMTFREVETLFHEFGHGLQHMLTTVGYADVSGLRGIEWDAVELPSQFMENWCYHPETLMEMSRHVDTGAQLPKPLFEKLKAARTFRAGSMMLRQIYFARLDLELHHRFQPGPEQTIVDVQRRIAAHTTVLPPLAEDRFLCGFTHIFAGGYAAGYYSYKWAEVLSADAFSAFEEAGLGDPRTVKATGRRFRDTVLALGGSVHPLEVFTTFRGRSPTTEALLRHSGLVTG